MLDSSGDKALLAELAAVYRDADRALSGWTCENSTDCCRFAVTGREPYVTSIEVAAIRQAVAQRGGWRALDAVTDSARGQGKRRGLRVVDDARRERRCPLLTREGRCAVYASRPLGCRTFYCDRAQPAEPMTQEQVNELVRRIKTISQRHERGGDAGRPLTRALER